MFSDKKWSRHYLQIDFNVSLTDFTELKQTPLVIGDLLWKPFDSRFQDTLEWMKFHINLVTEEIQLDSTENLQRILHAQTKQAEDTGEKMLKTSSLVLDFNERFDEEHKSKPRGIRASTRCSRTRDH